MIYILYYICNFASWNFKISLLGKKIYFTQNYPCAKDVPMFKQGLFKYLNIFGLSIKTTFKTLNIVITVKYLDKNLCDKFKILKECQQRMIF